MAAVITLQSSSTTGPTAPSAAAFQQSPASDHHHHQLLRPRVQQQPQPQPSHAPQPGSISTPQSPASSIGTLPRVTAAGRDAPSCDACVRRKSRCAINEMINKCYSCDFHRQDCTFTLSVTSRPGTADVTSKKRKLDDADAEEVESPKRQSTTLPPASNKPDSSSRPTLNNHHILTPAFWFQSTQHIGLTTELEPALLEFLPLDQNNEGCVASSRVRKFGDDGTFMRVVNTRSHADSPQTATLDAIESLVAPYGSTLVEKFFEHVHPSFPILMEDSFRQSYRARTGLTPLLLSAVYVLALKFVDVGSASQSVRRPDAGRLESTALKLLTESLPYASMSTVQAGLLLMQRSNLATAALNAQLVTAGFELGLHQDCSNWRMETWEKGLRKRLAWALYMQDKWSALVHGRPSHIVSSNWMVQDLVEQDFTDAFSGTSAHDDAPVGHGPLSFCHMVALTTILSDILDRFYTLQAIEEFRTAGNNRTRMILERAKPAQIRLKEWFGRLPTQLKMDSGGDIFETVNEDNSRNGALHLAYFATEITLHRCIVRSLSQDTADAYLSHICRSAAKTRLISAMDFVNRLRPMHLRSFWPAAARTNFALIGSFGVLLRVTAPTKEESEFYRLRLCEYRWTLSVSKKDAEFLEFALESLDSATNLDHYVPEKPGIDELMTSAAKPTINASRSGANAQLEDSMVELEQTGESGRGGTSSVISGLASPATSISDDSVQDASIPPL
ncbi:putative C6 transcription factor (OTam) [Aspergillus vadensis CBS 113365]|uniref:Nitrogen regulatory protein OTam n=1 Tax=Aspergillus vadensis (strain CBS 113365 / IMI 142717 / IBT 24658) TaxID=1448311 RepID=A0A319BCL7_ASPVC|nr:nitrogen regulatory protein OTam [Aspergillus vadensis CBS 113365]PYH70495.1 nitrogen regulatory protein OTam [Aspergillus vadensis CBS 113365]